MTAPQPRTAAGRALLAYLREQSNASPQQAEQAKSAYRSAIRTLEVAIPRIEAEAAGSEGLRAALESVEWYMNGDGTEGFCTNCTRDWPGPHDALCLVGAALAAQPAESGE